jgi:WW domain-binding protein 4
VTVSRTTGYCHSLPTLMSEYWVSKKKYFCKYCEIYIADDAPSRQQHENGLRHQGNRERFIRNIYKSSEKKKKDLEDEKRELARVEQVCLAFTVQVTWQLMSLKAAHAAFAQDVGAGLARPSLNTASGSSAPTPARKPTPKSSDPFANYTTAESLGYNDPDTERAAADAERRRMQGVAGEWQVVTPSPPPPPPPPQSTEEECAESSAVSSTVPLKREVDAHSDDDYDRHSKLRKKAVRTGLGEIYDPGIISVKVKKEEPSSSTEQLKAEVGNDASTSAVKLEGEYTQPTGPSKWVKVQWNQIPKEAPIDGKEQRLQDEVALPAPGEQLVKTESECTAVKAEETVNVNAEEPLEAAPQTVEGSLFKKRRTPASVATNRARRNI